MSEERGAAELADCSQDIEKTVPDEQLLRELEAELNDLIERVQALKPDYAPRPAFARRFSSRLRAGILGRLRASVDENWFELQTWQGVWDTLNRALERRGDFVKRRLTGEYETDEWGLDREFLEATLPFFLFLYRRYWRVESSGVEHIPAQGRALLVGNHSGQLPWDCAMVTTAIYTEHPAQRLARTLYSVWFPTLPFISSIFTKLGQVLATVENGTRLLEQDELVSVYPEGHKGVGKLYKDRYRLVRFGRGGFVKMAINTQSPIIPVAVVGAEETYVSLAKSGALARLTGFPYFPITPTFPWLGPLGMLPLPSKWYIDFGEPIPVDEYGPEAAHNLVLISQLTDHARNVVQGMICERLARRPSVFF
jgi:1-acyl-sn-glycerol-3-phosphate acyltransferase